jgi:hypothetical protein
VEELTPAGEMIRIMAYLDHPIIARAAFLKFQDAIAALDAVIDAEAPK